MPPVASLVPTGQLSGVLGCQPHSLSTAHRRARTASLWHPRQGSRDVEGGGIPWSGYLPHLRTHATTKWECRPQVAGPCSKRPPPPEQYAPGPELWALEWHKACTAPWVTDLAATGCDKSVSTLSQPCLNVPQRKRGPNSVPTASALSQAISHVMGWDGLGCLKGHLIVTALHQT